jgi:hypothetical protein
VSRLNRGQIAADITKLVSAKDAVHFKLSAMWGTATLLRLAILNLVNEMSKEDFRANYLHDVSRDVMEGDAVQVRVQKSERV